MLRLRNVQGRTFNLPLETAAVEFLDSQGAVALVLLMDGDAVHVVRPQDPEAAIYAQRAGVRFSKMIILPAELLQA